MNIKNGDTDLATSIFTILEYMTRGRVAEIKSKKKVNDLEKDYLKIRSNFNRFEELCKAFPLLKNVDHFTPGVEACLLQIVNFLNMPGTWDETVVKKIVDDAKKASLISIFIQIVEF